MAATDKTTTPPVPEPEAPKESATRPYFVMRQGADGHWEELGEFVAPRPKVAMEAAHEKHAEIPTETTVFKYRAHPVGNDAKLSCTVEVKPVLTWT